MKGYSKMNLMNRSKSKSTDFSDQPIKSPRIQKPKSVNKPSIPLTQQQPKNPNIDEAYSQHSSNNQEQDANFSMERLTRNRSVAFHGTATDAEGTSTLSSRFKMEKQKSTGGTLQSAVKRAMSIRRSSSVSERYSRIHDQYGNAFDVDDDYEERDEDLQMSGSRNHGKIRGRGSILKACKRIFGL